MSLKQEHQSRSLTEIIRLIGAVELDRLTTFGSKQSHEPSVDRKHSTQKERTQSGINNLPKQKGHSTSNYIMLLRIPCYKGLAYMHTSFRRRLKVWLLFVVHVARVSQKRTKEDLNTLQRIYPN